MLEFLAPLGAVALLGANSGALARTPQDSPDDRPSTQADATPQEAESGAAPGDYWSRQEARPFVATTAGVGVVSRGSLAVGYGKPHYLWAGLEGAGVVTPGFAAATAQLKFRFLLVNFDVGIRQTESHTRRYPTLRRSYEDASLEDPNSQRQSTTSVDGCLFGYAPLGPLLGYWEVGFERVLNPPPERAIYFEYLAYVGEGGEAWSGRYAAITEVVAERVSAGPVFDFAVSPSRPGVFRVGGLVAWTIGPHLALDAILTAPVATPDSLDLLLQIWGIFRVNWTFASGEPSPGFP